MTVIQDSGKAIRNWLITLVGDLVGNRVHQDTVPQIQSLMRGQCEVTDIPDFVYFSRAAVEYDDCLGQVGADPDFQDWNIEIVSQSIDLAQEISQRLYQVHGFRGLISSNPQMYISSAYVQSQSDDYELQSVPANVGFEVVALDIRTVH